MTKYPITEYTLRVEEVAEIWGYTIPYIRFAALNGKIPALKRTRRWFFCEKELEDFFTKHNLKDREDNKSNDRGDDSPSNIIC